jgi:hypothetical protein
MPKVADITYSDLHRLARLALKAHLSGLRRKQKGVDIKGLLDVNMADYLRKQVNDLHRLMQDESTTGVGGGDLSRNSDEDLEKRLRVVEA